MSKHTPLPWKVHSHSHINKEQWLTILNGAFDITHNGAGNPAVIACSKYSAMSNEENLANAEFIVRACNSYYDMLEAAENVIFDLELLVSRQGPGPDKRLEALKAAIRKAKGE